MIFTAENTLLIGSILLFVSIVVGKTGYRFGVPTLLLFLVVGMLFGSDGLGLQFHDAKDAQFIGMVALSIILFSGGMDTKFKEIKMCIRDRIKTKKSAMACRLSVPPAKACFLLSNLTENSHVSRLRSLLCFI